MKRLWILALVLFTTTATAAVINIKVYDAFGESFATTTVGKQLKPRYNLSFEPNMVLVLGPSATDPRVQEQGKTLNDIDPAEHGILFAVGTLQGQYGRGFSITPNRTRRMLASGDAFLVLVLGPTGKVLHRSKKVMKRAAVLRYALH